MAVLARDDSAWSESDVVTESDGEVYNVKLTWGWERMGD